MARLATLGDFMSWLNDSGCKPTPTSVSASRGVDGWTLLAGGRATNPRTNLPRE